MKFYLIVSKGKQAGMPIAINDIDLFVIGTGRTCQLRSKKEGIGEQQCALVTRDRKVFIRDLDSGHSTLVNGDVLPPSEEWPLHAGDKIAVGPLEFMIQFSEQALSQRDLEEWALKCLDEDAANNKRNLIEELESATKTTQKAEDASKAAAAILDRMSAQRGVVQGRLRISREEGVVIIRIGEVFLVEGAELALLKKELHQHLSHPNLRVLLDFKVVRRMSSTAAEMFADLVTWLRPWGSSIAFCRLKPDIQEALQSFPGMTNIRFFPDKEAALAQRW